MLFVHGLGGGPYELEWLGTRLSETAGVSPHFLSLPGHEPGRARAWMPASTAEQWLDAGVGAYERLRSSGDPVSMVGFSTGALVALRLAERLDEAERGRGVRVAALAPFVRIYRPRWLPVRPETLLTAVPWLSQVPRRGPPLRDRARRRQTLARVPFRTMNLDAARSALGLGAQTLADAGRLQGPVLLLQGRRDTVVDPEGAQVLHDRLTCPRRLVWLPRSDHLVGLDIDRHKALDELTAFLRSDRCLR